MRRFNYTGRRDLKQDAVDLEVTKASDGALSVKGSVDLDAYGPWPADADVVLEAWQGPAFERFSIGRASVPKIEFQRQLTRFRGDQSPQFRVKIVSETSDRGKLLGLCQIRARRADDDRPTGSMLHVTVEPLDHEIFKLRLEENKHPVLVINENLPTETDYFGKGFALTPLFVSLVMPQIFRTVVTDVLLVRRMDEEDESPGGMWIRFARSLNTDSLPPSDDIDARRAWLEIATAEFSRCTDVMTKFRLWSIK